MRAVWLAIVVCACGGDDHGERYRIEIQQPVVTLATLDDATRMRGIVDAALAQARRAKAQVRPPAPPCDPFSSPTGCGPKLTIARIDVQRGPTQAADVVTVSREHLEGCLGSVALTGRLKLLIDANGRVSYVIVPSVFGAHRDCMRTALQAKLFPTNATDYTVDVELDFH